MPVPTRRWRCRRIRGDPDVISQALTELRLAGVDGPYSVLLSADVYTKVSEATVNGYPIREHINRLIDGDIIWAPAIDGAFVSAPGRRFRSPAGHRRLDRLPVARHRNRAALPGETMTFLCYTAEASVALTRRKRPSRATRRSARSLELLAATAEQMADDQASQHGVQRGEEQSQPVVGRPGQRLGGVLGVGIRPTTRPSAELMPAMSRIEPLGFSA